MSTRLNNWLGHPQRIYHASSFQLREPFLIKLTSGAFNELIKSFVIDVRPDCLISIGRRKHCLRGPLRNVRDPTTFVFLNLSRREILRQIMLCVCLAMTYRTQRNQILFDIISRVLIDVMNLNRTPPISTDAACVSAFIKNTE
jgi:hypothetical protein